MACSSGALWCSRPKSRLWIASLPFGMVVEEALAACAARTNGSSWRFKYLTVTGDRREVAVL